MRTKRSSAFVTDSPKNIQAIGSAVGRRAFLRHSMILACDCAALPHTSEGIELAGVRC
jgi:hypothetical protein